MAPASVIEVDLEGQGWVIGLKDGGMKLRGRERDEFALVRIKLKDMTLKLAA